MPYCSRCGKEVPSEVAYCPNCGARIRREVRAASTRKWLPVAVLISTIFLAIVIGFAAFAPYQVRLVEARPSFTILPPTITFTLTLSNDVLFAVRVDTVLKVNFTLGSGQVVEKEYYFDTVIIPAGGVERTSTTIPIAFEGRPTVATIPFTIHGPITTNTITYSHPLS